MQSLDVNQKRQKIKKTKPEIKKELEESIANGIRNENAVCKKNVNNCATDEDAVKVIQELEDIIKNKRSDIIWLDYHQGQIFQKFKEKERFANPNLGWGRGSIPYKKKLS